MISRYEFVTYSNKYMTPQLYDRKKNNIRNTFLTLRTEKQWQESESLSKYLSAIIQNFGVTSQNLKAYYMFDPVGHVDDHCYNCWM